MNRRSEQDLGVPANRTKVTSLVLTVLSLGVLVSAGCAAKHDQGRVVTTAEAQSQQDAGRMRIENDTHMSEKARTAVLRARASAIQGAGSQSHPPPPPPQ